MGNTAWVHLHGDKVLILASGSRFRARVMAEAGIPAFTCPPDVDERALDDRLADSGVEEHALHLAEAKARSVLRSLSEDASRGRFVAIGSTQGDDPTEMVLDPDGVLVIGADQLGVVETNGSRHILHKMATSDDAVAQLMVLSGTTHKLVNGLVVVDGASGEIERGVDVMTITMRPFTEPEARVYVERFEPFDSAGSYRIEDQDEMEEGQGLVTSIEGEDLTGVLGMPVPLLRRMLVAVEAPPVEG